MTREEMKSDLAYLREMAESGARAPLLGGRFALWWGSLATLVLIAHWAIVTGRLPLGPEALWILWLGFIAVGSAGSAALGLTLRAKPGLGSAGNRASSAVWPAMGASLLVFWLAITAGVITGRLDALLFNLMLPVALLGYAIAWLTTAQMARRPALFVPGAVALAGMAGCVIQVFTAEVYLVAGLAVFLSTVVPGLLMMRGEPQDTV